MGVGEGIVKCLLNKKGKYRIIGTNMNSNAPLMYFVDNHYIIPPAFDDNYLSTLLSICEGENIELLIPGSEEELKVISMNQELFLNENIIPIINSHRTIEIGLDKWKTYTFCKENGFFTPYSKQIEEGINGDIEFPCIIKSRSGHGSKNVFVCNDKIDLDYYINFFTKGKIPAIIQQYIGDSNTEYTIGIISDKNQTVVNSIVMRRELYGGFSQFVFVEHQPVIQQVAHDVAQSIDSIGPLNIQGRFSNEDFYIIEINPRFSGSAPFRMMAGLNEPDILIDLVKHNKYPEHIEISYGFVGSRFLQEYSIPQNQSDV